MGVYETCCYMLTMPPEIRILFCLLRLSHWFAFQYCLLSLINTCMKNFAYYVYDACVIKLVYNLGSPNFHSLSPGLWPSMRRIAIFPTSSNYMETVKTPVWIANFPSISFQFRHYRKFHSQNCVNFAVRKAALGTREFYTFFIMHTYNISESCFIHIKNLTL